MDDTKARASKGGTARAAKLSKERQSEIASAAAKARWRDNPIRATHAGIIRLGDIEIECAVLPDGRRVVSERAMLRALSRPESGGGRLVSRAENGSEPKEKHENIPRPVRLASLIPFVSADLLARTMDPIAYISTNDPLDNVAKGLPAEALPLICEVWLKGRDAGVLTDAQMVSAMQADLMVRGLAMIGIIALIDEATGYQAKRDKEALQHMLDQFLRKELAAWAKRFPDEFYQQIFRLRGWEWKGMKVNRPSCVGTYTKDIVYARMAPGIVEEIQTRMPKYSSARWHQWLTDEIGHPALAMHIQSVIVLMRASRSWDEFQRLINAALPLRQETLVLPVMQPSLSLPVKVDDRG